MYPLCLVHSSNIFSVSSESSFCSLPGVSLDPFFHQVSLFLEAEGKKVGAATAGSMYNIPELLDRLGDMSRRGLDMGLF